MKHQKITNILTVVLFVLPLALGLILFVALPDSSFSEQENRPLQTFPKLSLTSLTEGKFGGQMNSYFADQFPARDAFVGIKGVAELALGKEIFTGHTELVILNECDEREILEYMLNEWKAPPSCRVANGENADEILKNRKAEEIVGVIETAEEKCLTEKCDIVTVLGNFLNNKNGELPLLTSKGQLQNRQ